MTARETMLLRWAIAVGVLIVLGLAGLHYGMG